MGEVILDKEWLENNENEELYYMYRDLWKKDDKKKIRSRSLRYDITVVPPLKMGKEFVKTKGHYHPKAANELSFPEIYEVLEGKAHYLLQRKSSSNKIEDVVLIEAESGEKVLIPPNYGHITINPTENTLKMANWVNRTFDSIYKDIVKYGGAAYFELTSGEFIENEKYGKLPKMRRVEPTNLPEFGIESEKDMYSLIEQPQYLDFLKHPKEFEMIFEEVLKPS